MREHGAPRRDGPRRQSNDTDDKNGEPIAQCLFRRRAILYGMITLKAVRISESQLYTAGYLETIAPSDIVNLVGDILDVQL